MRLSSSGSSSGEAPATMEGPSAASVQWRATGLGELRDAGSQVAGVLQSMSTAGGMLWSTHPTYRDQAQGFDAQVPDAAAAKTAWAQCCARYTPALVSKALFDQEFSPPGPTTD